MRSIKTIAFCLLFIPNWVFGQYFGGYFEVEYVGGASDFKVNLTTYTDDSDPSQYCTATAIVLPEGRTPFLIDMYRDNGPALGCDSNSTQGQTMSYGLMRNHYSATIPYSGSNSYNIRFLASSYSPLIENQPGGQQFVLGLFADLLASNGYDSSPSILNEGPIVATIGQDMVFNAGWVDSDADSVVFKILPPPGLIGHVHLESYSDTFRIDRYTGIIELINPRVPGWFSFSVHCDYYRNGWNIGYTLLNQSILVLDTALVGLTPYETGPAHGIRLFPNPASAYFQLHNPANKPIKEVIVHDMAGKKVLPNFHAPSAEQNFGTSSLPKGIYFVEVRMKSETIVLKLVVN